MNHLLLIMPRHKMPGRLDKIADTATEIFIKEGYAKARITDIARAARVSPGTVYLYADGKEALFDLALRRSLEDPTIWELALPHPPPGPGEIADHAWRCLQNAAHFPRLWLAADSAPPASPREELAGILQELAAWMSRYRRAIKLIERSASDWPDLAHLFYRRFWRGGVQRIAGYLERRMAEGVLVPRGNGLVVAHLVVEALGWMAIHRYWSEEGARLADAAVAPVVHGLLLDALVGPE
jgi:AcrR family transcriptional regulator